MSFGIKVKGHLDSILINTDWKSLVFIGKATPKGSGSYYPADQQSYQWVRNFGPYLPTQSEGPISGTGVSQFIARAETTNCGFYTVNLTTPNDNGYFVYQIDSPSYPHLFCHTTSQFVVANILGVVQVGTGINGWPKWDITVALGYPEGSRSTAQSHITIYCFSSVYNTNTTNGVRVFDSAGSVVFNSDLKPLKVRDVVTINSTHLADPNNLSSLIVNDTTMSSPVTNIYSISKPSFLNVDWGRYTIATQKYLGILYRLVMYVGGATACEPTFHPSIVYNQDFIASGLRLNDSRTARIYSMLGLPVSNGSIIESTVNTTNIIEYAQFPTTIPVIDGADYD